MNKWLNRSKESIRRFLLKLSKKNTKHSLKPTNVMPPHDLGEWGVERVPEHPVPYVVSDGVFPKTALLSKDVQNDVGIQLGHGPLTQRIVLQTVGIYVEA